MLYIKFLDNITLNIYNGCVLGTHTGSYRARL